MLRKLRAIAKAVRVFGGTANLGRIKALRDQTLQQLSELPEQRQILEHTMRPRYTEAQYRNSLARIQADERRLEAKLDRYDAQLREISAGIERRSLEFQSNANPDEPGHAPLKHGELLGIRDSDKFQSALDQLTDEEDEADHDQPEDSEPYVSPPLTADAPGICPLCSREILESREAGAWDATGGTRYVARCPDCSVTLHSAGPHTGSPDMSGRVVPAR